MSLSRKIKVFYLSLPLVQQKLSFWQNRVTSLARLNFFQFAETRVLHHNQVLKYSSDF